MIYGSFLLNIYCAMKQQSCTYCRRALVKDPKAFYDCVGAIVASSISKGAISTATEAMFRTGLQELISTVGSALQDVEQEDAERNAATSAVPF